VKVSAYDLLAIVQRIEDDAQRERGVRYGPRTLDIDIIFYGDLYLETAELILPHPLWRERPFVHDLLGDVLDQAELGSRAFPGVEEALQTGGRLSPGLREVEPIATESFPLDEKEAR
jgi:7,8-dihydro-6-hydroxymethylpterin-pyrophosphokinase